MLGGRIGKTLFVVVAWCGCTVGAPIEQGAAGATCYPGDRCNAGLYCLEGTCVVGTPTSAELGGRCSGGTRACYHGPTGSEGVGICRAGEQECVEGRWGACGKQILPLPEVADGRDNDCDGEIDEDVSCRAGDQQACGDATGACEPGRQTCSGDRWGLCEGAKGPEPETCDGLDNDCDGEIDETLERACYTGPSGTKGRGACRGGLQRCSAGDWGDCVSEVTPRGEACDGLDNNCDGMTDEGCDCLPGQTQVCGSSTGECRPGEQTCDADGHWDPTCEGAVEPADHEICDDKDNDCNGEIDEEVTRPCYNGPDGTEGQGLCHAGVNNCSAGVWDDACLGEVTPQAEVCDGLDNDCDGSADNGELCANGNACGGSEGCVCGTGAACTGSQLCCGGQCAASCPAILQNATVGVPSGDDWPIQIRQATWVAWDFEIPAGRKLETIAIGFDGADFTGGTAIGAIVKIDRNADYPDSADLTTPDVLLKKNIALPASGSAPQTIRTSASVTLGPGWYLVLFGTESPTPVAIAVDGNDQIAGAERAFYFTRHNLQGVGMGKIPHVFVEGLTSLDN